MRVGRMQGSEPNLQVLPKGDPRFKCSAKSKRYLCQDGIGADVEFIDYAEMEERLLASIEQDQCYCPGHGVYNAPAERCIGGAITTIEGKSYYSGLCPDCRGAGRGAKPNRG